MHRTNYKAKTWLRLALGAMLALTVLTTVQALWKFSEEQRNLMDIATSNSVKTSLGNSMEEQMHIISAGLQTMVLLNSIEARMREEEKILRARETYDKQWSALQAFTVGESGRQIQAGVEQAGRWRSHSIPR